MRGTGGRGCQAGGRGGRRTVAERRDNEDRGVGRGVARIVDRANEVLITRARRATCVGVGQRIDGRGRDLCAVAEHQIARDAGATVIRRGAPGQIDATGGWRRAAEVLRRCRRCRSCGRGRVGRVGVG